MKKLEGKVINNIIKNKRKGLTVPKIADICGVSVRTVHNYTKDLGLGGKTNGPGRPKKMSKEISKMIENGFKSNELKYLSDGCFKVYAENNLQVSKHTIHRCLRDAGLKCYKKQKKHDLTGDHIKRRFAFSEKFKNYDYQDWEKVIWSDESSFDVVSSSGVEYYWNERPDSLNEKNIKKTKKFGGGSVMVWGCITPRGVGKLVRIDGILDSQKYTKLLSDGLFESINRYKLSLKKITFMHDNAPIHSSYYTKEWLRFNKVKTIEWPSHSPDINPIENLWGILDEKLRRGRSKPKNKDELWSILEREWYSIDSSIIRELYLSMTKRVDILHKNNGAYTKY